ncbi:MAG: branched-chain amino acid aminotransferase [Candidatus Hodarchaeales archaeon]|jgi:branched-chain amino acid aminotransferase
MDIKFELVPENERKPKITDPSKLGFGINFTDHMLFQDYKDEAWQQPVIKKLENFSLHPSAMVFHYGQEIFEGMKCFKHGDGKLSLFRPVKNAERFNRSARRMCMPEVDTQLFLDTITKLIQIEKDWVPSWPGTALYIRPTMIATEAALGVHTSTDYYFYIILSPVGAYFATGFEPTKIHVETEYIRAALGGVGEAKTGGNYAASLLAGQIAKEKGYSQVLWLDAIERKYVEEVGAMNMFFVMGDTVYTAPLNGSILEGITRESVIQICIDSGFKCEEKSLTIDEVIGGVESGNLTEAFGSGTAASITPVGEFFYKGQAHVINDNRIGSITQNLYDAMVGIQTGKLEDNYGWNKEIPEYNQG